MPESHHATPSDWAHLEEQIGQLRAPVEALEAAQHAPTTTEARPSGLVERVAKAIAHKGCFVPEWVYGQEARAAIREVAAWLSEHTDDDASAYWAARLEQEAER
jgi:hypothetical protein